MLDYTRSAAVNIDNSTRTVCLTILVFTWLLYDWRIAVYVNIVIFTAIVKSFDLVWWAERVAVEIDQQ